MDRLKNKSYERFNYTSRYTGIPYYYDIETKQDVYGIIKPMLKNSAWVAHKISQEDNLDALALKYYNNPSFWWIIAFFNNITDPFIKLKDYFDIIKIPNISSISFGDLR